VPLSWRITDQNGKLRRKMELNLPSYNTAYISFSADINQMTTEHIIATSTNMIDKGFNRLYYLISTPGGNVMNGLNIYNVLRGLPAKIVFHNVGNVDSMGNVVFLSGDERYACPHSTFMFHGVGFDTTPSGRVSPAIGVTAHKGRSCKSSAWTVRSAADGRDMPGN
jgi:ATP-dependent protease ClpP protease subunit